MQLGMNCRYKGKVTHDVCRACSLDPLRPCHYSPDMLEAMRYSEHDRTEFTPSSLLECRRRPVLSKKFGYYTDPDSAWNMLRGTMVHALMEQFDYPENSVVELIRERRIKTTIETKFGSQVFSGKPDLIVIQRIEGDTAYIKVVDYKTKKEVGHDLINPTRSHQMQLNMYAYLAEIDLLQTFPGIERVEVTELELVYVDMKRVRRFTSAGQLHDRGKLVNRNPKEYAPLDLSPIHLLPRETTEQYIRSSIEEMIEAKEVLPAPLEGEAAWLCPYCPMQEKCFALAGKPL